MMKKILNGRIRVMKEKHVDGTGGRKASSVEICTGFLKPSMITFRITLHHWKR